MKHTDYSDYELVKQFIEGNHHSIDVLIDRHKKKLYNYIFMLVKNRTLADDIYQETFFKVIKSLKNGKYHDNGKFTSWMMRIAHNLIIDHFRKCKQLSTISNDDYEADLFNSKRYSDTNVEEDIVQQQISKDIKSLIDELPDDQREVVILRHYVNMSFKEIADFTGVSINTALGRMRYAILNMRKIVEEKEMILS